MEAMLVKEGYNCQWLQERHECLALDMGRSTLTTDELALVVVPHGCTDK